MPADAGRITAQIDGDISGLKSALGQARSEATSAVSGIEGSFRSNLGSGLKDSMSGIASSMGPIGGALSAIGPAGIAAGAGIAVIGGALSSSVQAAAGFETSMSGVAKTTGLAGPELSALGSSILEMSSTMPVAASELANIAQVAGSLGVAKEELIGFSETAAQMSVAFEMPAEQAATAAAKILTAFGMDIDTSNMESLGNVVNTMGDSFAATEPEVLDFINRASFLNTTMGQSIPQVAALGTALISSGMSAETASTGIKSFLNAATMQGEKKDNLSNWAKLLGTSVDELKGKIAGDLNGTLAETAQKIAAIEDPTERFQAAVKLAGTDGAPAILKLAAAGDTLQSALQKANSEWENGSSMMKTFEQNSSTLNAEWDTFTNTITRAGVELGNVLLPYVTDAVSLLNDGALAAINFGEAIYDLFASDSSSSIWGTNKQQQIIDEYEAKKAGETAAENIAEGITESDDLKEAPGEALSSPEAKAAITKSSEELAKDAVAAWKENFVGEIFGEAGNLEDKIKGQVEIGGGLFTALDYDINNDFGNYKLRTPTGDIKYSSLSDMKENLVKDVAEYVGRELSEVEAAQILGDTQTEIRLKAAGVVDTYLDFSDSMKDQIKAAGKEIAAAYAEGIVPDVASIDSRLEELRKLKLYDPEEARWQGTQNAINYLEALSDAIEAYDKAKAKYLVEPDNDRAKADLERTRANLQAQLNANPLKATITTTWGQFDTKSLSEIIFDPAAMKAAAAVPEKFFMGTIVPGIQSGMEEAKAALTTGQITEADVYDAFIKPLESVTEYLPGWLDNLNTLFRNGFIDFDQYSNDFDKFLGIYSKADAVLNNNVQATQAATVGYNQLQKAIEDCEACVMSDFGAWQEQQENLFNPSYIGAGGQAYLDWKNTVVSAANEAAMAVQAVGGKALGSAATPQSIPVSVTLDTSKATAALTEFEGTAKKDVQKPLDIDSSKATASLSEIDSTAKQTATKPLVIDSSQAMSAIAAINSAASQPVYKTVYVNEVYTGSSGGSSGGGGGGGGGGFGYSLPPIFMARGGYVDRPTLAVVGESGPEYVIPAEKMARAASGGGGINITINSPIYGGGSDLEALLEQRNRELVAEITEQIAAARRGL